MATQLSELLDRKDALERQIAAAIRRDDKDTERDLRAELLSTLVKINALTVEQAQAHAQREFLR